jgi:hypothetical protein
VTKFSWVPYFLPAGTEPSTDHEEVAGNKAKRVLQGRTTLTTGRQSCRYVGNDPVGRTCLSMGIQGTGESLWICGSTCGIAGGIPRSRKFVSVRRNISAEALPHGASWRSVFCLRTRFVRISAAPRSTVQTTERRAVVQTSAHIRLPPRRFRCCYESGVTGPGSDHGGESIGSGRRNPSPAVSCPRAVRGAGLAPDAYECVPPRKTEEQRVLAPLFPGGMAANNVAIGGCESLHGPTRSRSSIR